jgi:UDP-N-acetylglucosamine 4,6-dehydratase
MNSVLITGGAGFFGRAFARRALEMGVERVCILSRGEYTQHQMRQEFNDDSRLRFFVGDVRDPDRLKRAMEGCDTVIHAAALKRIEVGQYNADEMAKTNVGGAINVIEAAKYAGVRDVVALSTDKAASPCNVYGQTKAIAENMFMAANISTKLGGPNFAVTRYGNVSGSTGSVIPTWRKRIAEGNSVTVTDPDATRFWMHVDEAVDIVLFAMGSTFLVVPELPAYRVGDLVQAMDAKYDVVGLRQGEKIHEIMTSQHEMHEFFWSGRYWIKGGNGSEPLPRPLTSDQARRMTVNELREKLQGV